MVCFIGSLTGSTIVYLVMLRQKGYCGNNQVAIEVEPDPSGTGVTERSEEDIEFQRRDSDRQKVRIFFNTFKIIGLLRPHGLRF